MRVFVLIVTGSLVLLGLACCDAFLVKHSLPNPVTRLGGTSREMNVLQQIMEGNPFVAEAKSQLTKMMAGRYNEEAIREKMDTLIKENPVLMLSFSTCPYCRKSKQILNGKGIPFNAVELDELPEGESMRAEMASLTGRTSVPAIWIGEKFIGGCEDGPMGGIVQLAKTGELDAMIKGLGLVLYW